MKKSRVLVFVALIAAFLAIAAGWHFTRQRGPQPLVLHGNVDVRQISLAFEGSGRVLAMRVEEGDPVRRGDIVAVLDTTALALQADEAKARIDAQEQLWLQLRHGARPQELEQARSRVVAAKAEATRARLELARLQTISADTAGRAVSAQDLDRARSVSQAAQAALDERLQALRLTEAGPRAEELAAAAAQLKAAQAQLALLRHQIAEGELRAPADALVRSRLLEPGDMAEPQRAVYSLELTRPKWVRVYVGEPDLGRVHPGMAARVVTDSDPAHPIQGKIGYIASVAEFTPKSVQTEELRSALVYEVRVLVSDPGEALRLGQPATVYPSTEAR